MTGYSLDASPLPDHIPVDDWMALHRLLVLAGDGASLDTLLDQLASQLGARAIQLCYPADPPPDMQRAVVVPLHYRELYLGDLYLEAQADTSSAIAAERLAFFAPLIALQTALNKI